MTYRLLADENVEVATTNYLRKLGHEVERLDEIDDLGLGVEDRAIAAYACEHDRLILTQDDDFFTELDVTETAGVIFQKDQTLSARDVGDVVDEMSQYIDQTDVTLEYVSSAWL